AAAAAPAPPRTMSDASFQAVTAVPLSTMRTVPPLGLTSVATSGSAGAESLAAIRDLFPAPISNPAQDAHFLMTLFRGIDQIDAMKRNGRTFLGERTPLDLERARAFRMPERSA